MPAALSVRAGLLSGSVSASSWSAPETFKRTRAGGRQDTTTAPAAPQAGKVFGVVSLPFSPCGGFSQPDTWDSCVVVACGVPAFPGDKMGMPHVPLGMTRVSPATAPLAEGARATGGWQSYSQAEATVVTLVILVESSDQGWRFWRAKREELWTQMGSAWMGWLIVFWKASCCSCMRMRFACCRSASRSSAVCLLGESAVSGAWRSKRGASPQKRGCARCLGLGRSRKRGCLATARSYILAQTASKSHNLGTGAVLVAPAKIAPIRESQEQPTSLVCFLPTRKIQAEPKYRKGHTTGLQKVIFPANVLSAQ